MLLRGRGGRGQEISRRVHQWGKAGLTWLCTQAVFSRVRIVSLGPWAVRGALSGFKNLLGCFEASWIGSRKTIRDTSEVIPGVCPSLAKISPFPLWNPWVLVVTEKETLTIASNSPATEFDKFASEAQKVIDAVQWRGS